VNLRIGCGSWADDEYVGLLYPTKLPAKERLRGYAAHFNYAEVNSTYYALPRPETVATWIEQTPPGFRFDLKLHRAFSQSPAKSAAGPMVARLRAAAEPLVQAERFGVFFLVAPPTFGPDRHGLEEFDPLRQALAPHRLAIELRHSGWVEGAQRDRSLAFFRTRQLVWICVDMPRIRESTIMPPEDIVTNSGVAYLRLHGRNPRWLEARSAEERHAYEYPAPQLTELAARIRRLAAEAREVHVVANNHAADYAPRAALALKAELGV